MATSEFASFLSEPNNESLQNSSVSFEKDDSEANPLDDSFTKQEKSKKKKHSIGDVKNVVCPFSARELKDLVIKNWCSATTYGVYTPDEIIVETANNNFSSKNWQLSGVNLQCFIAKYKEQERLKRSELTMKIKTAIRKELGKSKKETPVFSNSLDTGSTCAKVLKTIESTTASKKYGDLTKTYTEWAKEVV